MVTAALYSNWCYLGPLVGRDLPVAGSYISELGALTRPHHTLVNAFGACSGICCLLLTVQLWRLLPRMSRWQQALAALAIFGVTTTLSAVQPMTCAPSIEPGCTAGGITGHAGWQDLAESASSVLADIALPLSILFSARAFGALPDQAFAARGSRAWFALTAALTITVGGLSLAGQGGGLPQRALDLTQSTWLAALALWCARLPPGRAGQKAPSITAGSNG
ncbi:DUF998 domain-containing protein [Paractinoplanes ferrugineus]|uniref:DUF998 domain-containing protein n=1 Tax=Paractinoplanes ferrugineus TaxID=113564 RepID=UPI001942BFBD|nr:DUF998 domain-containing protein [Actinoplanes ferrugineus]